MADAARPLAKVIATIPAERVLSFGRNGVLPKVGDLGEVEHMYTGDTGDTIYCVYCLDENGKELWSADMLASEFTPTPRETNGT